MTGSSDVLLLKQVVHILLLTTTIGEWSLAPENKKQLRWFDSPTTSWPIWIIGPQNEGSARLLDSKSWRVFFLELFFWLFWGIKLCFFGKKVFPTMKVWEGLWMLTPFRSLFGWGNKLFLKFSLWKIQITPKFGKKNVGFLQNFPIREELSECSTLPEITLCLSDHCGRKLREKNEVFFYTFEPKLPWTKKTPCL